MKSQSASTGSNLSTCCGNRRLSDFCSKERIFVVACPLRLVGAGPGTGAGIWVFVPPPPLPPPPPVFDEGSAKGSFLMKSSKSSFPRSLPSCEQVDKRAEGNSICDMISLCSETSSVFDVRDVRAVGPVGDEDDDEDVDGLPPLRLWPFHSLARPLKR